MKVPDGLMNCRHVGFCQSRSGGPWSKQILRDNNENANLKAL